jgi:hypothetical protein
MKDCRAQHRRVIYEGRPCPVCQERNKHAKAMGKLLKLIQGEMGFPITVAESKKEKKVQKVRSDKGMKVGKDLPEDSNSFYAGKKKGEEKAEATV